MRRVLVVLALALALAPALVQAQPVPGATNPCDASNFSTTHVAPDSIAAGGSGTVTFTVANNGKVDASVNLTASTAKTPGWRFTSADSQTQSIAAGAKANFAFTISSDASVTVGPQVDVAGVATCQAPAPIGAACPAQTAAACIVQLKPDSAAGIALAPQSGFHIPGLDNLNFPVEYLIAGIVLLAVLIAIPLALRRRKGAVGNAVVTCPEPLKPVRAGKGASFPIELKNTGDKATKLALDVGSVPEGWSAFLPLPEIQLAPKEARGLWLMVRSPPEAKNGDAAEVEVRATDTETNKSTAVKVRAEVMPGGA